MRRTNHSRIQAHIDADIAAAVDQEARNRGYGGKSAIVESALRVWLNSPAHAEGAVKDALVEYRDRLRGLLGNELHSVLVYGSQARGDARPDSDIDVLCLMNGSFDHGDLIIRTSKAASEVALRYDVVISTMFATRRDFEAERTAFLASVRREAIVL